MPKAKLDRFVINYDNGEEYHGLKQEVFTRDLYYFETNNPTPVIIDAGAHLGLSTLYFKKMYPVAHILAIEPHPTTFKMLEANIFENQLDDVETLNVALSDHHGSQTFFFDETPDRWWSTASFLPGSWVGSQQSQSVDVETRLLSEIITGPIDFLKMDIEGAEQSVLTASQDGLSQVKHLMIEFHPHPTQSLSKLAELLERFYSHVKLWRKGQEITLKQAHGLTLIEAW